MGQSKPQPPNLPDPLDPSAAAPNASPDELLSQLAGDEIDRLLAEADSDVESAPEVAPPAPETVIAAIDGEPPPAPPQAEAAPPSPAADVAATDTTTAEPAAGATASSPLDTQLDDLFKALNDTPAAPPAADAPPAPASAAKVAAPASAGPSASELDEQLARLAEELLPESTPAEPLTPVDAPVAAAGGTSEVGPAASPAAEEADERSALLAEAAPPDPAADDAAALFAAEDDNPAPWYVRPLLWLNAPFAPLSDHARAMVGKVALATILFSVTVLAYLAVTRR